MLPGPDFPHVPSSSTLVVGDLLPIFITFYLSYHFLEATWRIRSRIVYVDWVEMGTLMSRLLGQGENSKSRGSISTDIFPSRFTRFLGPDTARGPLT